MDKDFGLTVGVAVSNRLAESKPFWATLMGSLDPKEHELLVVDNGSTDGSCDWLRQYVIPRWGRGQVIRCSHNVGVFHAFNTLWTCAENEVVAVLHNDLYITEYGWDKRVLREFESDRKLGVVGFCGARGIADNGLRYDVWSNLLEAEIHGSRGWGRLPVSVLDGMALIVSRTMMEEIGGLNMGYSLHHRYDYELCLAAINAGYNNLLLGIACHHQSGLTASSPEYITQANKLMGCNDGDQAIHDANHARYVSRWRHLFGRYV